jgi:hypothetical protein
MIIDYLFLEKIMYPKKNTPPIIKIHFTIESVQSKTSLAAFFAPNMNKIIAINKPVNRILLIFIFLF